MRITKVRRVTLLPTAPHEDEVSVRDRSLIVMVLQNRTDREIADDLGVEELAIRREVEHLVQRLGYSNRDAFTRTLLETHPDCLEPGLLNRQETFPRRSNSRQRGRPEDFDAFWMFGELA